MKVFMTGGTGFVGTYLSRELAQAGHAITILSRRAQPPAPPQPASAISRATPTRRGPGWRRCRSMTGSSIWRGPRFSTAGPRPGKRKSWRAGSAPPAIWWPPWPRGTDGSSSAAPRRWATTDPGGRRNSPKTPRRTPVSWGRWPNWEAEALKAQDLGVRVVVTRFGVVLGRGGGALSQMAPLFRKFLGGPIGSGVQWFSWIHQADHARAFRFIQANPEISGPVNLTAPYPVRNRDLTRALGRLLHRPSFMPTPEFMLRLVLGEFADTLLTGQKVLPKRLLDAGFTFRLPHHRARRWQIYWARGPKNKGFPTTLPGSWYKKHIRKSQLARTS